MSILSIGGRSSSLLLRGLRCVSCSSAPRSLSAKAPRAAVCWRPLRSRALHTSSCLAAKITIPFHMPDPGEGILEVVVNESHVKPGDRIKEMDLLCVVQSDKAVVDMTSPHTGVIKKLHYEVGDTVLVGAVLIEFEIEDDSANEQPVNDAEPGPGVTDENVSSSRAADSSADCGSSQEAGASSKLRDIIPASPAVRHLARQYRVDLKDVSATGKHGRVLKEDIVRFIGEEPQETTSSSHVPTPAPAATSAAPAASSPSPAVVVPGEDRVVAITGMQKTMVKTMTAANAIPTFGYCDEINMNALVVTRKQLKRMASERDIKLSFMPFFIKAASMALNEYPVLNSSPNADCSQLTYKAMHNIGVAMDTPAGLAVPVVKAVQTKSVLDIAGELQYLMKRGADGKLGMQDLSGGTFSLSNIGAIGGTYARPVLLPPQVLIGALGRTQVLPRFDEDDEVIKAHIMNVSWSADHRVIDGATVARFSNLWKQYLEQPVTLLASLR